MDFAWSKGSSDVGKVEAPLRVPSPWGSSLTCEPLYTTRAVWALTTRQSL
jgi:hypothetical protein